MTAHALLGLSLKPIFSAIRRAHLKYAEQHALMCAEVESKKASEAMANAAYYQKQAALARSLRQS